MAHRMTCKGERETDAEYNISRCRTQADHGVHRIDSPVHSKKKVVILMAARSFLPSVCSESEGNV